MQLIRFGMNLDGNRGWILIDQVGSATLGQQGLLNVLEVHLGLVQAPTSHAKRIVDMRQCLVECCTGSRFFEGSFKVDELGVAEQLLNWRDQWYEAGWNGDFAGTTLPRLQDMVALEKVAQHRVAAGIGQRLQAVSQQLAYRQPQIDAIELTEAMETLPLCWQQVLKQLPIVEPKPLPVLASVGTDLFALQTTLLADQLVASSTIEKFKGDGSVQVVRAESALTSSQWLAEFLKQANEDTAVLIPQQGTLLDAALHANNHACLGQSESSVFRPALQLLPLALKLLQAPIDLAILMQFLAHPVNPLRSRHRRRIAEHLANCPGVGGAKWHALLQKLVDEDKDENPSTETLANLQYWTESTRYSKKLGLPLEILIERTQKITQFFQTRLVTDSVANKLAFLAAHDQAKAFSDALLALSMQGTTHISFAILDKLLAQSMGSGVGNPLQNAEVGAAAAVNNPAALIDSFANVVWWTMSSPAQVQSHPWSSAEQKSLRDAGVSLPDLKAQAKQQALSWLRPVLLAQRKLVLVLPPEGEELHPFWWLLNANLASIKISKIEDCLIGPQTMAKTTTTKAITYSALPAKRRWWSFKAENQFDWDKPYSFSSLEPLLFNPYQWVLNYPANLRKTSVLSIPADFTLMGTLAHRMVEKLYCTAGSLAWTLAQLENWFDSQIDTLIDEEGAVLLMAGKQVECLSFKARLRQSVISLHQLLQTAGITSVQPEQLLEGTSNQGDLKGFADLLLTLSDGSTLIVDMKWAGQKKYREKLQNDTHLQLILYAKLVQEATGSWPEVAYFILHDAKLLTTAPHQFKGVTAVTSTSEPTKPAIWQQVLKTWAWRKAQFKAGMIEVIVEGTEPNELSTPPEDGVAPQEMDPRYNAYLHLAGWEQ